jgi:glycosyltransferase involved in cell wall biosynthesis
MRVAILANFPLHVIPSLSEEIHPVGHYATWLPPLAEAWSHEEEIDYYWITLSSEITERKEITFWNQTFIVLPTEKKGRASSLFKADRAAIEKALRQINPDVVHGWGTEDVYALAAITSGYPSIISMQGILSYYIFKARADLRTFFQAIGEFFILRKTKMLTCESRWAKPILQRRAPSAKITCIEYGVHSDFFAASWQPDSDIPVALFVGTLVTRKGIQDVLKAFRSQQLKEVELWIAGSGPLEKMIEGMPNVKKLSRLDRPSLIEKMSKAWCLVLPSRADTSPNVVKEARVMGLPVITTRHGGQSDYIRDGKNGFIVEPGDIACLTDRLQMLLSNYEFCLKCGKDGWEQDRALFRAELTAERFRDLYKEVHNQTNFHKSKAKASVA